MRCRACNARIESMRTTDTGVVFICEKCCRDLSSEEVVLAPSGPAATRKGSRTPALSLAGTAGWKAKS